MKQSLWNIIKFKNFENEKSNLTEFQKEQLEKNQREKKKKIKENK